MSQDYSTSTVDGPNRAQDEIIPCPQNILRPEAVAPKLLTTVGTLAKWRLRGCGPAFVRLGQRIVGYRQVDIDAWIEKNLCTSTSGGGKGGRKKRQAQGGK